MKPQKHQTLLSAINKDLAILGDFVVFYYDFKNMACMHASLEPSWWDACCAWTESYLGHGVLAENALHRRSRAVQQLVLELWSQASEHTGAQCGVHSQQDVSQWKQNFMKFTLCSKMETFLSWIYRDIHPSLTLLRGLGCVKNQCALTK